MVYQILSNCGYNKSDIKLIADRIRALIKQTSHQSVAVINIGNKFASILNGENNHSAGGLDVVEKVDFFLACGSNYSRMDRLMLHSELEYEIRMTRIRRKRQIRRENGSR